MPFSNDLQFAVDLARGAGKIALEHYGRVERLTKTHVAASSEAVTEADRACQRFIVAGLKKKFPGDGIVGEENDAGDNITVDVVNPAGRNWVIDPIDGTNNFIAGLGLFGVCIGLLDKGHPVLGVVYDVTRDHVYCAAKGEGAWLGNRRVHTLQTPLTDASLIMLTSNVLNKAGVCPGWITAFMSQTNWKARILGSAALEAVQVSAGIAHGAITVNGKLWDIAAPAAIVIEAGGIITDLHGKPVFPYNLTNYTGAKVPFLAAAPQAHADLLREILAHP